MGQQAGRKSALRRAKLTVLLTVILALSLAPAILLQQYPRETLEYVFNPFWGAIGLQTGSSLLSIGAIYLIATFIAAVVAAAALAIVITDELWRSVRQR
jgi:hypothetical protein